MLTCIIIDDVEMCREALKDLLTENFNEISILAVLNSAEEGIHYLKNDQPDVVFLDVEMPGMSGFDMLTKLGEVNFEVVFTTSHEKYSMQALKTSALDFLLKPVQLNDLRISVHKIGNRLKPDVKLVEMLTKMIAGIKNKIKRIALPTMEGLIFVQVDEIMHCDADDNNTMIYFDSGKKMLITKTLKNVEELLTGDDFVRIHNSHLVNINHIRKYVRGNGGHVVMNNNNTLSVARARKESFLDKISHL